MAKERTIKRNEEQISVAEKAEVIPDTQKEVVEAVKPEVKAIAPMNVSYQLPGRISATGIRVVGTFLVYNEGCKMRKVPIVKGKPVIITITQ